TLFLTSPMKISFVITDKLFEKSVWIIADGFSLMGRYFPPSSDSKPDVLKALLRKSLDRYTSVHS
ncbi:hypothetical protein OB894_03050, partial [Bacillus subtilis]